DLPDPDTPVTTVRRLCGMASETFLRLWTRAPRMNMDSSKGVLWAGLCGRFFNYPADAHSARYCDVSPKSCQPFLPKVGRAILPAAAFPGGKTPKNAGPRPGLAT